MNMVARILGIASAFLTFALVAGAAQAEVVVRIDKGAQRMSVSVDGEQKYSFVISTGTAGGPPNGSYRPQRLERDWRSRTFNMAPMPYSIFFHGPYAIHGTNQVKRLGSRASHGCVRLHPGNAAILFNLVKQHGMANTRIIVSPSGGARTADLSKAPKAQ
jgi:lipoprotein-anchoring transpeptidase ErfK/SrfK